MPNPREPLIVIPGDVDQQRGYRLTDWHGYKNYECLYCQYATLWPHKMEKHLAIGDHPWAYPGQYPRKDAGSTADGEKGAPDY